MKNTVLTFSEAKRNGTKLTVLTAYDYAVARLIDESGINAVLVGDSLGMVTLGYQDTLPVTMQDMIHHSRAVARGVKNALLIADMPFMSYHACVSEAVRNAGRLVQEGNVRAVKVEGGTEICPQIRAIVDAAVPVMAHIGLTPQHINVFGGFKVQGKAEASARKILEDAKAVAEAGAFAVVLECIPAKLAALITKSIPIPTIGIGAGPDCDGQVLVYQDMLGLSPDFTPKFAKAYANLGQIMRHAFAAYIADVQQGTFPGPEHIFSIDDDVIEKLY